ncbi:MAG: DUF732 domain-containing protein [Elainellaceae cyanobacterium]
MTIYAGEISREFAMPLLNRFLPPSAVGLLLILAGFAPSAHAQDSELSPRPEPTGLCVLNELGGLWVNDEDGQLVQLEDLCQRFQPQQSLNNEIAAARLTELEEEFWQSFLNVASTEAIAFANQVNHQDVVDYGKTICTSLERGDTMNDVRKVQVDGGLPPAFDAAVNVAAINTYCPEFRFAIGR